MNIHSDKQPEPFDDNDDDDEDTDWEWIDGKMDNAINLWYETPNGIRIWGITEQEYKDFLADNLINKNKKPRAVHRTHSQIRSYESLDHFMESI